MCSFKMINDFQKWCIKSKYNNGSSPTKSSAKKEMKKKKKKIMRNYWEFVVKIEKANQKKKKNGKR